MNTICIHFDLAALDGAAQEIHDRAVSAVDRAVEDIALQAAKNWATAILSTDLPKAQREDYAKSLRINRIGQAHFEVTTAFGDADKIENGRPARDLKLMLQTSQRTRMSKAGKKYLIIPFRHNTPGNTALAPAMPQAIYSQALKMGKSSILSTGTRVSATGATVPQHKYKWGGRLPAGLTPKLKPHHATDIFSGMRRMETSTGKSKSSAWLTFRVMHQDSTGWIVPAKPGLKLAEAISAQIERKAQGYINAIVQAELS